MWIFGALATIYVSLFHATQEYIPYYLNSSTYNALYSFQIPFEWIWRRIYETSIKLKSVCSGQTVWGRAWLLPDLSEKPWSFAKQSKIATLTHEWTAFRIHNSFDYSHTYSSGCFPKPDLLSQYIKLVSNYNQNTLLN